MVKAIEAGNAGHFVPAWPRALIGFVLRRLPEAVLAKLF